MRAPMNTVCVLLWCFGSSVVLGDSTTNTYVCENSKKLSGCTYETFTVPALSLCSLKCSEDLWRCQSFNYYEDTGICELNRCVHDAETGITSLEAVTVSKYFYKKGSSGPCDSCNPDGTETCTESYKDASGVTIPRQCQCKSFAEGTDCSLSKICYNDVCLKLQTAATYSSAVAQCESLQGYLATIDSPEKKSHIRLIAQVYGVGDLYIGMKYYTNYEDYAYASNMQPVTGYSDWLTAAAPSQRLPCVKVSGGDGYKWMDVDCSATLPYFCETPQCATGYTAYNGSCYYFDSAVRTFSGNSDTCVSRGAALAGIHTQQENAFAKTKFGTSWDTSYPVSFGIHQMYKDGLYQFIHNDWVFFDFNNKYKHLGCFKDSTPRAVQPMEGTDPILDSTYKTRANPIDKCFYLSKWRHYDVFAVQDSGWCAGDPIGDYNKYGAGTGCIGGEGAGMLNDVYEVKDKNLYTDDVAFEGGWRDGDLALNWWNGNSWRWHDVNVDSNYRSVCKIDLMCPQGFVTYRNKCYKVITKEQSRDDARDECQRYRGADLFNLEYSDEHTYLNDLLAGLGLAGSFWTGIHDQSVNGDKRYNAMDKAVATNYDVFLIGADPIWRAGLDSASAVTNVEMRFQFPASGKIVGWEYYSGRTGYPFKFSVLRRAPGTTCTFTVIGINSYSSSVSGYGRVDVPVASQIDVAAGDFIAMTFTGGSVIRFNDYGPENLCGSTDVHPSTVGNVITPNSAYKRVYSFRAIWQPAGYSNTSPFVASPASGIRCFAADTANGMKVDALDCSSNKPAICEIKRRHRAYGF